jgi:glycosyltransferase involved in cell wall biosynthesis
VYYKFCLELIKKYKIQKRIEFLGSISNNEMPIYYNKAKLTIVPSIKDEGTSLSALEAMACCCPVISTNVGGLKDLPTIKSNIDARELAKIMGKVLELNNWHKISQMQFKSVTKTFNLKNWKKTWFSVLENSK